MSELKLRPPRKPFACGAVRGPSLRISLLPSGAKALYDSPILRRGWKPRPPDETRKPCTRGSAATFSTSCVTGDILSACPSPPPAYNCQRACHDSEQKQRDKYEDATQSRHKSHCWNCQDEASNRDDFPQLCSILAAFPTGPQYCGK